MKALQQTCGIALSGQQGFRNETATDGNFKNCIVYKGIAGINKKYAGNKNKLAKTETWIYNTRKNQIQEESHVIRR